MCKITIIGSCVCRDLFDNNESFEVHTDIRFCSPISITSPPVDHIKIDNSLLQRKVKITNGKWYKKNLLNDVNKTYFDKIAEDHGDWLILDLAEARQKLCLIEFVGKDSLMVTNSVTFREHYAANLSKNILKNAKVRSVDPTSIDISLWEKALMRYIYEIKKIFPENRIILLENYPTDRYVDLSGRLRPYYTDNHLTEIYFNEILLSKLYGIFKVLCPHCHIVSRIPHCIGDQSHKWGNHPLHFTKTYYDFLLETITDIVSGGDERQTIRDKYSELLDNEYYDAIKKTASAFYMNEFFSVSYKQLIENSEEFSQVGRKKKFLMLLILNIKEGLKSFSDFFKKN